MATDLDLYFPYDGTDSFEAQWRAMGRVWTLREGVVDNQLNNLECIGDGTGTMQVKVKTGRCWIGGNFGENTTQKTVTLTNPHATLARIDRVVLRNDFAANKIVIDVLTGTASGSPAAPALTQNTSIYESSLAQVAVAASGSAYAITAGMVTDERRYTSERGPICKAVRTAGFSLGTSSGTITPVPLNALDAMDTDAMHDPAGTNPSRVTISRAGRYRVSARAQFDANATGVRHIVVLLNGTASDTAQTLPGNATLHSFGAATDLFDLVATDYVEVGVSQNSGSTLSVEKTYLTVEFVSPSVARQ